MTQWHWDLHKRKRTGGKSRPYRKKRAYEAGGEFVETQLGPRQIRIDRVRGGSFKIRLMRIDVANVTDPKTNQTRSAKILRVVKNPANVVYDRRGIISKGAIIETELGQAKVTSRPGQDGVLNAVLIEE